MDLKWSLSRKLIPGTKLFFVLCLTHSLFYPLHSVLSLPAENPSKSSITSKTNSDGKDASEAKVFVEILDKVFTSGMNKEMTARWGYITNITEENEKAQVSILSNQAHPQLLSDKLNFLDLVVHDYKFVFLFSERDSCTKELLIFLFISKCL